MLDVTAEIIAIIEPMLKPYASYQRQYLNGGANASGSDLRGKAKSWVSYYYSRKRVEKLCREAGAKLVREYDRKRHGYCTVRQVNR